MINLSALRNSLVFSVRKIKLLNNTPQNGKKHSKLPWMLVKLSKLQLMLHSHRLLILVLTLSNRLQQLSQILLKVLALPFHAIISLLTLSAQLQMMKLQALHSPLDLKVQQQPIELPLLLVTSSVSRDSLKMTEQISLSSSKKSSMRTKTESKFFLALLPQLPRSLRSATLSTTQILKLRSLHWMTCSPLKDGSVTEDLLSALPLVFLNSKTLLMLLMKLSLPLRSRRLTPSSNSGRQEEATSTTKETMRHSMSTVKASPLSNLSSQETQLTMRSLTNMILTSPTTLLSQRLTNSAEASPTLSLRRSMPRLLSSRDAETLLSSPAAKSALNSRLLLMKSSLLTKEALPPSLRMLLPRSELLSPSLPQKMRPLLSSLRDSTPCTSGMSRVATSLQFSQISPPQLMDSQKPATAKLITVPSLT